MTTGGRASDEGPTLGEVVRRLDNVTAQLTQLLDRLDATYTRRDVYDVQRKADVKTMTEFHADLEAIVERQRRTWQLAVSGLVFPLVVVIVGGLVLAVLLP